MWELDTQKNGLSSVFARKTVFNCGNTIMSDAMSDESGSKNDLSLFTQRLRVLVGETPVARFARESGVNESSMRAYLAGKGEPGLFNLRKLVAHTGQSLDWLCEESAFYPAHESTVLTTDGNPPPHVAQFRAARSEYMELPLYDITAGAGAGKWNENARVKSWLSFRRDWLSNLVGAANGLSLITVDGDSMEPTLKSGAVVMVRDIETFNFSDGIYFMLLNGRHVIKRIQRKSLQMIENGRTQLNITVVSDNEAYAPIDVTLRDETLNETTVLARAVWLGVKLP